jgi:hypothetical protein
VLEEAWASESGPRRIFLQSLIHLAVGFYHARRNNPVGASRQLRKGLGKLAKRCEPFDHRIRPHSPDSRVDSSKSAPYFWSTLRPRSELVIPTTSCRAATRAETSGRPIAPVAPATNTFISFPPDFSAVAGAEQDRLQRSLRLCPDCLRIGIFRTSLWFAVAALTPPARARVLMNERPLDIFAAVSAPSAGTQPALKVL